MARGRFVSKSLSTSQKRAQLHAVAGPLAEFCQALYPLLVAHADDFGREAGDAFGVKHGIDPTSPRSEYDFDKALNCLHEVGLITRYIANGRKFLQVNKFDEHQQGLHKRTRSHFPDLPGNSGLTGTGTGTGTGSGREDLSGIEDRDLVSSDPHPKKEHALRARAYANGINGKSQPNPKLLTVIAKDVVAEHQGEPISELCELVKDRAAKAKVPYDAGSINSAVVQASALKARRSAS